MKQDYFDTWSPEMAYYLGWIWADGSTGGSKLQLGCVTEDEEILLGLTHALDSHNKIIRTNGYFHKNGYWVKPYTQTSIYGKELLSCLIKKHNIQPRKTYLNLPFPKINKKYLPYFIRGYFDGDGSIFKSHCVGISIIGTKEFLNGMQAAINTRTGLPVKKLSRCKKVKSENAGWKFEIHAAASVLTFLEFIYNSIGPHLSRKKKLAEDYSIGLQEYCKYCGVENKNNRIRLRFLGRSLGEYRSIEECVWARNYAYLQKNKFPYPVKSKRISKLREAEIMKIISAKLAGSGIQQRSILKDN